MANRVITPVLGVRLDASNASAEHSLGTTVMIHTSGEADGTTDRKIAVYCYAGEIISASLSCAINAAGTASASAGGYFALASANSGEYFWARSSAVIA